MSDKNQSSDDSVSITAESMAKQQHEQPTQDEQAADLAFAAAVDEEMTIKVAEMESLKAELLTQKEKAEKQWDIAVRAKAEVENIRRRAERDVENAHKYSVEKLLNELLPILDSLEQGLASVSDEQQANKVMLEGMTLTLKMFEDALNKFAVEKISPEGEAFDPSLHEAMSMLENQEVKPGTILHVVQKGYTLHGRLVRPARVIVAKAAASADKT